MGEDAKVLDREAAELAQRLLQAQEAMEAALLLMDAARRPDLARVVLRLAIDRG